MAQVVEQLTRNEQVEGSSPSIGSLFMPGDGRKGGRATARRATAIACNRRAKPSTRLYGVGWAEQKNAPVPIQGQMRENTSAVPPCLTDKSAHLTQAPTRPKPANAGSASRNTHRSPCFPRALGGPFAGSLRSDFQPWPESLCVRRRFDLRLNGLAQCSTADALCQDWSCIFHVLHVTQ